MSFKKQYIICAAIWFQDGRDDHVHLPKNIDTGYVVAGRRHHNCFATCKSVRQGPKPTGITQVQGFLTSDDYFVDREEAVIIALAAGQIDKEKKELFSEDIY